MKVALVFARDLFSSGAWRSVENNINPCIFRTRDVVASSEQKNLLIYTILRFEYLCFKRICRFLPIIGHIEKANWNMS